MENKLKSLVSRKYNTKVWDGKFTGREESMIPTKDLDIEKSANLIVLNSRKNKYPDLPFTVLRNTKNIQNKKISIDIKNMHLKQNIILIIIEEIHLV